MERREQQGLPIRYADRGDGPALVLLHGFMGSADYWERVVPLLEGHFRCIVPDLLGHGASEAPEGPYTIERLADGVFRLLDELKIEQAVLLGHSMGGYTALSFAERYPERLSAFGLIHSTPLPDDEAGREKRTAVAERVLREGVRPFVEQSAPNWFAPDNAKRMTAELDRVLEIGFGTNPRGAAGAALAMRERPDRKRVIRDSKLPVLLIAGGEDGIAPPEKAFAAENPRTTKRVIEGAGHMSLFEAPQELARQIASFAESL
ncbi:alpha/beta fold hydrolase [Saccharibacillus alkalitolerans]|uniref:Alpha/beta fold hydrolase n=1 Tax=Saccharibacillus alkalitolerans TaxID=2705290 RepID=A0ABX0FBV2_9BACL|nr:alpha/beta fold hydrolase [Saccharibacillus alkalitolerans]NGZ77885.1 alpha/beta fold hydrolase [Saccharibacillus alkalitolerans]